MEQLLNQDIFATNAQNTIDKRNKVAYNSNISTKEVYKMTNTTETIKSIQEMAPKLNEKQQHVVLGMLMGMIVEGEPKRAEPEEKAG